ncbi:hypothetical protein M9Y10_038789 [Tritrichomonas musculus]|uniref:Uncharacterized protein n=1 Tax=Tritrichomonas musculus TaxID=1915356 RepID=A0ABR2KCJ8_9EUKA
MEYKFNHFDNDSGNINEFAYDFSLNYNIKETNTDYQGLSQPEYDEFEDLLRNIISVKVDSDNHKISLLERLREKLIKFNNTKKKALDLSLFRKYKTIEFLFKYSSDQYPAAIREASLSAIVPFIAVYPVFTGNFVSNHIYKILNQVFQNSKIEENRILLYPSYKCLGNIIQNFITHQFNRNLLNYFINNIDIPNFIQSVNFIDKSDSLSVNFAIYSLFNQSYSAGENDEYIFFTDQTIIQLLSILTTTICSTISEETCENKSHLYALNAIDIFLRTNSYSPEARYNGIIQSDIHKCIERYFRVEGLLSEKCTDLSIISSFYQLGIPDFYNCKTVILPLFEYIIQNSKVIENSSTISSTNYNHDYKHIKTLCRVMNELIQLNSIEIIQFFYENDILNKLAYSLKGTISYQEKSWIILIITNLVEVNYSLKNSIPMHDFFFTDRCIDIFINLLGDEDNKYAEQVLHAIYIILDVCEKNGTIENLTEIILQNDGIDALERLENSNNEDISSIAIFIKGMIIHQSNE